MAEEALACFTSLENTLPTWIADLETILTGITATQTDLCLANQPAALTPKPSRKRPRSVISSLKSNRSKDEHDSTRLRRPSPKNLTNSDVLRISQRKRKTTSACSGEASGELKFPNKTAAVVYYDGNTQKRFEQLVRAVGSSRNSIRKGKMSAKIESMARTGSSSSSDGYNSDGDGDDLFSFSSLSGKGTRSRHLPAFGRSDNTAIFDKVDAYLERAQSLCERAAHQVLRDGDCTTDINNATEQFLEALSITKTELPELRKRAQRMTDRKKRSEDRRAEKEVEEEKRRSASQLTQKILNAVAVAQPIDGRLDVGALEVDDGSDDDDGELNIAAMQFSKFAQMRSQRLATH